MPLTVPPLIMPTEPYIVIGLLLALLVLVFVLILVYFIVDAAVLDIQRLQAKPPECGERLGDWICTRHQGHGGHHADHDWTSPGARPDGSGR